jgi:hypothetical protein
MARRRSHPDSTGISAKNTVLFSLIGGIGFAVLSACQASAPLADPADTPTATQHSAETSPTVPNSTVTPPPPSPPGTAFVALLTPEQTAQIKALNLDLVVPTTIPPGFSVDAFAVNPDDRFAGYQILYRDDRDQCFVVEYTRGGIGGLPEIEHQAAIDSPLLDASTPYHLYYGHYVDPNLRNPFSEPELISDWLPIGQGFYRLAGATYANQALASGPSCHDIAVETAVAIIESSALITETIQGDGTAPDSLAD